MHCALLLCQSNCITTQNPMKRSVCVGSGVVVVNTGIAEVTRLPNEARAENPHHRFLRPLSTPRLICMARHTNNTFSWSQKMLRYSWRDMFNCGIIFCHKIFGQAVVIIRSTPDTSDFFNVPWLYHTRKMVWRIKWLAFIVFQWLHCNLDVSAQKMIND